MQLKKLTACTNGTRHKIQIMKNLLAKKNNFIKKLSTGLSIKSGRNSCGHITVRHKGGKIKNLLRHINFKNNDFSGIVVSILYDPKRSAFISLNFDLKKKTFFQTISTNSVRVGSLINCDQKITDFYLGCRTLLESIPTGSIFNNLNKETEEGKYSRSAGTSCQLLQKILGLSTVRLPSGKIISVDSKCSYGTLGVTSNTLYNRRCIGKAGINRLRGIRPSVRGIAMNPVDHPHGGRTNGGVVSVTPWGIPTKGKPTVRKKKF